VSRILKKGFRKLFLKTNLHILFVPNVVVCCFFCNMIIDGKDFDLQILMIQLNLEMELGILTLLDRDFLIIEGIYIKK